MHDKDPQAAAMASAEPCKDLEPGLPSGCGIDEKGQQALYQDDRASLQSTNSPRRSSNGLWTRGKMPPFRRFTLAVLVVAFVTVAYASVTGCRRPQDSPTGAKDASFQDLLNSVSDASLHDVLMNVYKKYRHGVFPEDRTAMQAVHNDNAAVATSLVELARRQNTNVTSVTVADSSTVVVVPTTETATVTQMSGTDTVVVVNTQTTVTPVQTTAPTDTSVQTTAPQVNPSSSQAPGQTSANGGTTIGKATTAPSPTTLIKTSSSTFTSTSPGEAGASTSGSAGVITTKISSTQQIVYTTTLPNGSQSTVTSYTVIPAGEQASTPGADGAAGSTMSGTPSLQNGAVDGTQPRGMGLIGSLAAALVFVIGIL